MEKTPKQSNIEHNKNLKEKFSLNEKIEQFYSKPESDEELVHSVGIIKDIPENIDTPKVLLKLGDPSRPDKFVHMKDEDQRDYIIALPIEKRAFHRDIANFCRKLYGKDLKILGGGWIKNEEGKLVVYGQSQDFGEADKETVRNILSQAFPDVKIESVSLAQESISKKQEEYMKTLEKIDNEVSKDLYADVVQRKAIRMGYDMTLLPTPIQGAEENMSYMIYRSENGTSFGIDTLYLVYKDKDNSLNTKEIAQTRWNLHVANSKIENGILTIEFQTDGQNMTISQPVNSLENLQPFSNLNDTEKIILDMYKNNQFVYQENDNSKVFHGSVNS